MSVFGIGGWELVLIIIIMLVVAGPKRMAIWAYTLGQWTAKLRTLWEDVAASIQSELKESGIDVDIPKRPPTRADIQRGLQDAGRKLVDEQGELKQLRDEVTGVQKDAKRELDAIDKTVRQSGQRNGKSPAPSSEAPDDANSDADDSFGTWGGGA